MSSRKATARASSSDRDSGRSPPATVTIARAELGGDVDAAAGVVDAPGDACAAVAGEEPGEAEAGDGEAMIGNDVFCVSDANSLHLVAPDGDAIEARRRDRPDRLGQ